MKGLELNQIKLLANLPAGMYIIQILSDHSLETKTIVKSK